MMMMMISTTCTTIQRKIYKETFEHTFTRNDILHCIRKVPSELDCKV